MYDGIATAQYLLLVSTRKGEERKEEKKAREEERDGEKKERRSGGSEGCKQERVVIPIWKVMYAKALQKWLRQKPP